MPLNLSKSQLRAAHYGEGVSIVSTARCDELRSVLDFSLTPGQETALQEILQDMSGTTAMLRLVQGDVGCGKTVVAALGGGGS